MRRHHCYCILCALAAATLMLLAFATPARAADAPVSFIREVAPILKENCFACHDSKRKAGRYDMTSFQKLMEGGHDGPAILAGKPAASDLHDLMVTADERRMPPRDKGEAVPKASSAIVERWIKEGAKLDEGLDAKADMIRELRTRWTPPTPPLVYRHPAVVNALAFTPDGKQLVVGGHHELAVWDVPEAKLVKRIATRAERAYAFAFLPGGLLAVAGGRPGQEGDVRLYDLAAKSAKTLDGVAFLDGVADKAVLKAHLADADDSILCLAATPDGKRLAAGGCDRTIRIWDLAADPANSKLVRTAESHADWVLGVAFTPDGKYVLSAGRDKMAKVFDIAANESILTFPDHQNTIFGVASSADGSVGYSVGADTTLRSWKPTGDGKQLKIGYGHGDDVYKVVVHPKLPVMVTASADKIVRLWDIEKLTPKGSFLGLADTTYALALSPDGTRVAAGGFDGEVRVWAIADAALVVAFHASPGFNAKFNSAPAKAPAR